MVGYSGPLTSTADALPNSPAFIDPAHAENISWPFEISDSNPRRWRSGSRIHGSDSGIYDDDGEFVPEVFHQWFQKRDEDGDGGLNLRELTWLWYAETDLFDFFGAITLGGEFSVLYLVAAEKISETRMRGLYDGCLFSAIASDRGTLGCRNHWPGA